MSSFKSFLCLAGLLAVVAVQPVSAAPTWGLVESSENGVPVLMNPAIPRDGAGIVSAVQQWRLGADETNDPLLGLPKDAVVDGQGNTYLLDSVLSTVFVISPSGDIVRQIGKEGDGPGEFRNASQLVFMPDGSLGILEMMPGQIVCLAPGGDPRPGFHPGGDGHTGMQHLQRVAVDGDQVILGGIRTSVDSAGATVNHSLVRHRADGSKAVVVRERKEVQAGGRVSIKLDGGEESFTDNWVLTKDGDLIVFPRPFEYRLEYYDSRGKLTRIVGRTYETLRRSDEQLAAARKQAEAMSARFSGVQMAVEERARDISAVFPRPDGSLWVASSQGSRARAKGSLGVFDVIDPAGRFVRTVRIDGVDYDDARDDFTIVGDRLYVFKEALKAPSSVSTSGGAGMTIMMIQGGSDVDEDDDGEARPFEVVCYSLGA